MSITRYENGIILTMDDSAPFFACGHLDVEDGTITAIGSSPAPESAPDTQKVDLGGRILMPGFISAHCHFYGQFVRGMLLAEPIENWQQVLRRMWWKVDRLLDEEQVYYSALLGLMDGLKSGTTTYFDHHVSAKCIPGSLGIIERAMREAGARGCLCYEVTDRYGHEGARQGIDENLRYAKKAADDHGGMFRGMMGLHASYTLGEQTLRDCVDAEQSVNCGIHTHLAEDIADVTDSYKNYDKHVADRMDDAGALGPKTIAAHGVHFKPRHFPVLKERGVTVAHNCQSNMNNAVGVAPVVQMLDAGVNVAIGGDGYTYDLFRELSVASIYQRAGWRDASLFSGQQIRKFAFGNTAALCSRIFGREIGQLKPGATADFIVLDYAPPTPLDADNYTGHLLCCSGADVSDVVINGNPVVQGGELITLDEEVILPKCREHSARLWKEMEL